VEAVEGTDGLLRRCAEIRREGPGGVLVKVKKPRQERRADLPAIGPETVRLAAMAGLSGIAVHAGHCMIIHQTETIGAADRAGLFVVGVPGPK
jgi:UDP-2,3-diacylglucosamine hydrolase